MRAVFCKRLGEPEDLVLCEVALPEPGKDEVRIRAAASAVSFRDGLLVLGKYQTRPPLPFTPGSELAGIVDAVGEGVVAVQVGDRVAAVLGLGCMADFVIARASEIVVLPDTMPFCEAAGFLGSYATAYHALFDRAEIQSGETVLVLGAGGGVGLAAVELAASAGVKVIAAASSEEKRRLACTHGAALALDPRASEFRDSVKAATNGEGVNIVFDPVGGTLSETAFRSLGWNGRHLVIGFASGDIPKLPLNLPLLKEGAILGVLWGAFARREPARCQAGYAALMALYRAGNLRPHVSRKFPLKDAGAAIRFVLEGKASGKAVIEHGMER